MESHSGDESKNNITENQKLFNDYVASLKTAQKLSLQTIITPTVIVFFMLFGTLFFNWLKFPWFLTMILIVIGMVGVAALDFKFQKDAFKDTKCPLCHSSLHSFQKDNGDWHLECIKCNVSAYTGYRGSHGGKE